MNHNVTLEGEKAIYYLADVANYLRESYARLMQEWLPDTPPPTVVFSTLGRSFCGHASDLRETELITFWRTVEELLRRGDDAVKNAISTGLLEVVLAEASGGRLNMISFARFLGPETMAYCKAWDTFTGYQTPGIS